MRTVKVDVWYPKNIVEILKSGHEPQLYCKPPNGNLIKGFYRTELEIPVEEQKVTINESTFQSIAEKIKQNYPNNQCTVGMIVDQFKEELGFEDE